LVLSESPQQGGTQAWFRGIPTYDGKFIEFQSFSMNKKNLTFIYILPVPTTHGHTTVNTVVVVESTWIHTTVEDTPYSN